MGLGLFVALGLVGLFISRQHFGHIAERETAAAEIGRARKFLDTVVQNIPAVVTVKDIDSEKYVLANRSAESLFGIARDDIVGKRPHEVFPQAAADLMCARDLEAMESGGLAIVDEQEVRDSGRGYANIQHQETPDSGRSRGAAISSDAVRGHHPAQARGSANRLSGAS